MTNKKPKNSYRAAKEAYGEVKKRYNVTLTQSVVEFLDQKAEQLGLSRSELMERIFRSMIIQGDSLNWNSFADEEDDEIEPQQINVNPEGSFKKPVHRTYKANRWLSPSSRLIVFHK